MSELDGESKTKATTFSIDSVKTGCGKIINTKKKCFENFQ